MDKATQNRSLTIIWITIFIDLMGITLIIPYINDFVAELGGDEQLAGFLLASSAMYGPGNFVYYACGVING